MIWDTLGTMPWPQLLAFVTGGLVLNFAPGQDVFFASACGVQGGARAGALAGLGVGIGVVIHVLLATAGLGAVIAAHPGALLSPQLQPLKNHKIPTRPLFRLWR